MSKKPANKPQRTAHIVSHTHWDREWRYPIWETRLMLIDFMDELVELLERGVYPSMLLDGQCSPVLDYLEVRPQMAPRVRRLIRDGKLQIGPWLTLPDEYPVSGEAMVRNLLAGIRRASDLGGCLMLGYTPFGWGQTAQLPQIYAGFGIDIAMVGKKVSADRAPNCEFTWRAPDGSELLATRFGALGRQNFYFLIHLPALFAIQHEGGPGWEYRWHEGGIAWHRADAPRMEQDHQMLNAPASWHPEYLTPEILDEAWDTMKDSLMPDDRLMMNGCDYTAAQPLVPEMIDRLNELDKHNDRRWVHTTITDYLELMRLRLKNEKLTEVEGELRDGPAGPLTGNALTTRRWLKALGRQAEYQLIHFAEPLSALAALAGAEYPQTLIDKAWDFLLNAQPHDSINGVTQDKTVSDNADRLNQVIELGVSLGERATKELIRRIDTSAFADDDVLVAVFNPLPSPRREIVEAWVTLPDRVPRNRPWPFAPEGLHVFDAAGNPVGTQWAGRSAETYSVAELHTRAFPYNCQRHRLFFDTGLVPPGGYKLFRVGSIDERRSGVEWADSQARTTTLNPTPGVLENDFLRVRINPNGTFDLDDKAQGQTYRGLGYFEDRGEFGDYWTNQRPMFDEVHNTLAASARVWTEEAGPLQATLVSEVTLMLPRHGDHAAGRRSSDLAPLTLRTRLTLRHGDPRLDLTVEFDNRHEDHYLRMMFPTGLAGATHADSGGHFTVDRRPIRPQGPTPESVWPDMATLPWREFVDLSEGKAGLAFLGSDLTEYEVLDNPERTVALSLLRAVGNWVCTETRVGSGWPSQKGGQCLGPQTAHLAILPHAGDWQKGNVARAAERFCVPVCPVQTNAHAPAVQAANASPAPTRANLTLAGDEAGLFEIEGDGLRFSAIKRAADRDSWIVRVYNPTNKTVTGWIRFGADLREAWSTNLNEDPDHQLKPEKDGSLKLSVPKHKIITVELVL